MIPSIEIKVQKEISNERKGKGNVNIVRKGYVPFSDSEDDDESDESFDVKEKVNESNKDDQKPKVPKRIIQKSTVLVDNTAQPQSNAINENNQQPNANTAIIDTQKQIDNDTTPQLDNNTNDFLNYINDNITYKEDIIDINDAIPTISEDNTYQDVELQDKTIQHNYQSQRERELMEKYVLNNNSDDSSEDHPNTNTNTQSHPHIKPVFINKRPNTKIDSNNTEETFKAIKQKQKQLNTSKIIQSYIQKDSNAQPTITENNIPLPDDTDIPDDIEEYEQWKIREMQRIKRQIEDNQAKINLKLEIERRRSLTNEQRTEENIKLGSDATLRNFKSKINYLQKYHHKGAFFQDEAREEKEHVYNRDFNLPTWEDKIDRSAMPEIMAKRRGKLFKKGQTKYTHLTNEDTTNFDPAFKVPDPIANNLLAKSGGYKANK